MNIAEILTQAKSLIDTPDKWIKGKFAAQGPYGYELPFDDDAATCFCALGAATRAMGETDAYNDATMALYYALPAGYSMVSIFNDDEDTTHADVMALFDRAIAKATLNASRDGERA